ncbi:N-acetylmuramoyl-L-alanine amidase [Metabacillus rhizolycopersici]|uniref:N-acetylmuramoyl-L-alanine amidase n=1 Tax=Metabacillus rhizolycopersici TaxID=2875709 RepID=A0ABS7UQS3_9BACI|nr:N-acetylmuramoyl-L-alanine amidase [Metabacillus rhizolycopersici]MBZ5750636.1 N-acetylmuramoyl-L-alanine amidase [Metabacillus rhizolycopersici]
MVKIYLDPGHGGADPGAVGQGIKEKDIVLDIALKMRTILLNDYENIEVRMSRSNDSTRSLSQRSSDANSWGANYFLSLHCNAANGSAQGYEDYIHYSQSSSSNSAKYQNLIHSEVSKVNELQNRGKKKANFHVLRATAMPSILTENGFIDNSHDASLMKESSWRQKVAQGHVNGLAKAFNLKRKSAGVSDKSGTKGGSSNSGNASNSSTTSNSTSYKIIAGSFKSKENAVERITYLRSKGIESFVNTSTVSGDTFYRVQAGAFSSRENAEKQLTVIKNAGINDAFILTENIDAKQREVPSRTKETNSNQSKPVNENKPNQNDETIPVENTNADQANTSEYSILGPTYLSPEDMNRFVKQINPNAIELGYYYSTYGEYYGIRGDIAFAQAMNETNFLRFTGDVKAEQNNFSGLGATGSNNPGASFETPSDGVLAHLQHLFAYASTKPLPNKYPLLDPRFNLVNRGIATTWVGLNGKWAVPGTTYGQLILDIYQRNIKTTMQNLEEILEEIKSNK